MASARIVSLSRKEKCTSVVKEVVYTGCVDVGVKVSRRVPFQICVDLFLRPEDNAVKTVNVRRLSLYTPALRLKRFRCNGDGNGDRESMARALAGVDVSLLVRNILRLRGKRTMPGLRVTRADAESPEDAV